MKLHDLLDERNILPFRSAADHAEKNLDYRSPHIIWRDIIKTIAPQIEVLGNGAFGTVVNLPGNKWVCKLWNKDDSYEAFLKFCQAHPNNPHLPKFQDPNLLHNIRKDVNESLFKSAKISNKTTIKFCIIEKLKPLTEQTLYDHYLGELLYMMLNFEDMLNYSYSKEVFKTLRYSVKFEKMFHDNKIFYIEDLMKAPKEFQKTIFDIVGHPSNSWKQITADMYALYNADNSMLSFDIYKDNVMSRNGELVITDPFS